MPDSVGIDLGPAGVSWSVDVELVGAGPDFAVEPCGNGNDVVVWRILNSSEQKQLSNSENLAPIQGTEGGAAATAFNYSLSSEVFNKLTSVDDEADQFWLVGLHVCPSSHPDDTDPDDLEDITVDDEFWSVDWPKFKRTAGFQLDEAIIYQVNKSYARSSEPYLDDVITPLQGLGMDRGGSEPEPEPEPEPAGDAPADSVDVDPADVMDEGESEPEPETEADDGDDEVEIPRLDEVDGIDDYSRLQNIGTELGMGGDVIGISKDDLKEEIKSILRDRTTTETPEPESDPADSEPEPDEPPSIDSDPETEPEAEPAPSGRDASEETDDESDVDSTIREAVGGQGSGSVVSIGEATDVDINIGQYQTDGEGNVKVTDSGKKVRVDVNEIAENVKEESEARLSGESSPFDHGQSLLVTSEGCPDCREAKQQEMIADALASGELIEVGESHPEYERVVRETGVVETPEIVSYDAESDRYRKVQANV